jgi:hypothetical protein
MNKKSEETKEAKSVNGILSFIIYVFRFRMKELLAITVLILIAYMLSSNLKIENGKVQWVPSVKINVEVKK